MGLQAMPVRFQGGIWPAIAGAANPTGSQDGPVGYGLASLWVREANHYLCAPFKGTGQLSCHLVAECELRVSHPKVSWLGALHWSRTQWYSYGCYRRHRPGRPVSEELRCKVRPLAGGAK